jgi:hypothetical protein
MKIIIKYLILKILLIYKNYNVFNFKDQIFHNKLKFDYYLTQKDLNKDMFLD